jgi:hypothetical protein
MVGRKQDTDDAPHAGSLPWGCDLRKRLLVLLAGNAVTLERWSDSWNDAQDWRDILSALREYLKLDTITWIIHDGKTPIERFRKHRELLVRINSQYRATALCSRLGNLVVPGSQETPSVGGREHWLLRSDTPRAM